MYQVPKKVSQTLVPLSKTKYTLHSLNRDERKLPRAPAQPRKRRALDGAVGAEERHGRGPRRRGHGARRHRGARAGVLCGLPGALSLPSPRVNRGSERQRHSVEYATYNSVLITMYNGVVYNGATFNGPLYDGAPFNGALYI